MSEILHDILKVKITNPSTGLPEWKQIPAIRGTSVYSLPAVPTSREVSSGGVTVIQYGYILTIWDEKKYILDNTYTGDIFEVWNGLDGLGTVNSIDAISPTGGTTNVQLDAVSFKRNQSSYTDSDRALARENIDAFQDVHNPTDGQVPRYSAASSMWYPGDLTPGEVGAVHSALKINGKSINNPTTNSASITLNVGDVSGAVSTTTEINGHTLNSNVTLSPNDIGAIHSALKINGISITNPTNASASISLVPSNIGAVPVGRTINGVTLASNITTRTIASNVSVASSAWSSNSTPSSYVDAGFPYRATVSVSGITTNMIPQVVFDLSDSMSGIFAPIAESITNGVQIYASDIPESDIIIPTIICFN